jgi:cyanophycinase-like exopeptidase
MQTPIDRIPGEGWLALIGGGEFSFGETRECDEAWLEKSAGGAVGFVPTASGSADYGHNFCAYVSEALEREAEIVPLYRARDTRRPRNIERLEAVAAIYFGGGLTDEMLATLTGTPAIETVEGRLREGGVVVAIAAAAHGVGEVARGLRGQEVLSGFGWLRGGVVETNFDPGHDRRLRELLTLPDVGWGLGIPAGSAILLGPQGKVETVGMVFGLADADADYELLRTHDEN